MIIMANKNPIPKIDRLKYTYAAAKMDPIFSAYVNAHKGQDGVDFLNTKHNYSKIVNQLKAGTPFSPSDINDLESFTAHVDQVVHCNNIVSTFKQSSSLDLPTLFNDIAQAKDYNSFKTSQHLGKAQQSALLHLFSIIKTILF